MSNKSKIHPYKTLRGVTKRIRGDLSDHNFVLLFAHNKTGKTRLSMDFKDLGKKRNNGNPDTLYFNAFTEDLFIWDNDLEYDDKRILELNTDSKFFIGLEGLKIEDNIKQYLSRYADFGFDFIYARKKNKESKGKTKKVISKILFHRDIYKGGNKNSLKHIKISRGEESIFVWCFFLAIVKIAIDHSIPAYNWVKYIYIDDPISSLDDNNAIAVASDLAGLLIPVKDKIKTVISSHHGLFFNVMWNELKRSSTKCKTYFYHRPNKLDAYTLRSTGEAPFLDHIAMLGEIQYAIDTQKLYTYHFNILRSILEKTATFFGHKDFSFCIEGINDEALYSRALNLLSHGKHSIYQPVEMVSDNKILFRNIFDAFLNRYKFYIPEITK